MLGLCGISFFGDERCADVYSSEKQEINKFKLENASFGTVGFENQIGNIHSFDSPYFDDGVSLMNAHMENTVFAGVLPYFYSETDYYYIIVGYYEYVNGKWEYVKDLVLMDTYTMDEADFYNSIFTFKEFPTTGKFKIETKVYKNTGPVTDRNYELYDEYYQILDIVMNQNFIQDEDMSFSIDYGLNLQMTKNQPSATVTPLARQKPIYVRNSTNDYYTGSCSVVVAAEGLIEQMTRYGYTYDVSTQFIKLRDDFSSFLANGKVKYLRTAGGEQKKVMITGDIAIKFVRSSIGFIFDITFNWTEVGD